MSNPQQYKPSSSGNYINFRSGGTQQPSSATSIGSAPSGPKKHKYPTKLSQNMEKGRGGEGSSGSGGSMQAYNQRPTSSLPTAEDMYNSKTNLNREMRSKSVIMPLRNFNNWVKGVLIYKYVPQQAAVLDISCGKGGDLFKYHHRNIRSYVGVDIARSSLVDCIQRYNDNAPFKFPMTLIHADVGRVSI